MKNNDVYVDDTGAIFDEVSLAPERITKLGSVYVGDGILNTIYRDRKYSNTFSFVYDRAGDAFYMDNKDGIVYTDKDKNAIKQLLVENFESNNYFEEEL